MVRFVFSYYSDVDKIKHESVKKHQPFSTPINLVGNKLSNDSKYIYDAKSKYFRVEILNYTIDANSMMSQIVALTREIETRDIELLRNELNSVYNTENTKPIYENTENSSDDDLITQSIFQKCKQFYFIFDHLVNPKLKAVSPKIYKLDKDDAEHKIIGRLTIYYFRAD